MKKVAWILTVCSIILTTLITGCAKEDEIGMPNPAAVYCEEQGGIVDLREGEGGVSGFCMFNDGSECEEWAFFNGECAPGDSIEETGMPNPASVFCEDQGGTLELRETAAGTAGFCLFDDGSECEEWEFFNGECQPGDPMGGGPGSEAHPPEEIADWWGVIGGTEVGDQFDDYFERQDLGQIIYFGIESHDSTIAAQIVDLRDSGKVVHLWGTLYSNVLDYNGSQVLVTRIEVDDPSVEPTDGDGMQVIGLLGKVISLTPGLQFDDYLQLAPDSSPGIGLEGVTPEIEAQIVALRDKQPPGQYAHFWGTLICPAIDFGECQLRVSEVHVSGPGYISDPIVVDGWEGTIHTGRTEPGSGGDDYFLLDAPIPVQYGIVSAIGVSGERDLEPQLVALRDSGTSVRIWGTLIVGVPDWNIGQIEITRIEVVGPAVDPVEDDGFEAIALYGKVVSLTPGMQFDDYLQLAPDGSPGIGLEGITPQIEAQIVALRDKQPPGHYAHFWGTLICPAIDYGECQLRVSRVSVAGPGMFSEPIVVDDWEGTIHTGITEPGTGGDDYFLLAAPIPIQYGIVSAIGVSGERDLEPQLVALRDTGTPVHIWGTLVVGIPDWNVTQIEITRIEYGLGGN